MLSSPIITFMLPVGRIKVSLTPRLKNHTLFSSTLFSSSRTMASTPLPDDSPVLARGLDFYQVEASVVGEEARKLLHEYSKIPEDQIDLHVENIVCYAWPISCISSIGC